MTINLPNPFECDTFDPAGDVRAGYPGAIQASDRVEGEVTDLTRQAWVPALFISYWPTIIKKWLIKLDVQISQTDSTRSKEKRIECKIITY